MDELIGRLVADVGIDRDVAAKAVAVMLAFLIKEGPPEKVKAILHKIPGAEAAAQNAPGGLSFGMGGIMGAGTQLMSLGLGMGQVQQVARDVLAFAREKAGGAAVDDLVGAIPGASQFI